MCCCLPCPDWLTGTINWCVTRDIKATAPSHPWAFTNPMVLTEKAGKNTGPPILGFTSREQKSLCRKPLPPADALFLLFYFSGRKFSVLSMMCHLNLGKNAPPCVSHPSPPSPKWCTCPISRMCPHCFINRGQVWVKYKPDFACRLTCTFQVTAVYSWFNLGEVRNLFGILAGFLRSKKWCFKKRPWENPRDSIRSYSWMLSAWQRTILNDKILNDTRA